MNMMNNATQMAGTLIGDPSFADAIAAIEKAEDLGSGQKRHWTTSLRQMGRYLDRPLTLIPTRVYFKGPWAKVEIALATGKQQHDRRREIRDRDVARDVARELSDRQR